MFNVMLFTFTSLMAGIWVYIVTVTGVTGLFNSGMNAVSEDSKQRTALHFAASQGNEYIGQLTYVYICMYAYTLLFHYECIPLTLINHQYNYLV